MPHLSLHHSDQGGFTLVELVIVIALIGIISVYAVMKSAPIAESTLPSQAQQMATDIRHAQTLAYTWGKRMRLAVTTGINGSYSVSCFAGTPACDTSNDFTVTLQKNADMSGSTLYFNSLGQPSDSAGSAVSSTTTYNLCFPTCASATTTETVTVAPLTGYVTVSP